MHPILIALIVLAGGGYLIYKKYKHSVEINKAVDEYNDAKHAQKLAELKAKTKEITGESEDE